jgi:Co/Zn/Cd efflux system component
MFSDLQTPKGSLVLQAKAAARYRTHGGSLTRAAFLSTQNDVLTNVAIIGAGLLTVDTLSAWPDLVVGLGIFFMNLDAAREVYVAARRERAEAAP